MMDFFDYKTVIVITAFMWMHETLRQLVEIKKAILSQHKIYDFTYLSTNYVAYQYGNKTVLQAKSQHESKPRDISLQDFNNAIASYNIMNSDNMKPTLQ